MEKQLSQSELEKFAGDIIDTAKRSGVDEADVYIQMGRESEITTRLEKVENLKEAISQGFGLRAFKNKKLGFSHSSDFSSGAVKLAIEQAISLANEVSADEFNGLPEQLKIDGIPDLDIYDSVIDEISTQRKIDICLQAERAMFEFDKRIVNSDGVGFFDGQGTTVLANTAGNCISYASTYCHLMVNPVALEDGKLQSNGWQSTKRFFQDLDQPQDVARIAAERTVRMLGARIPATAVVPVVFDNITGAAILSNIVGALDGEAVSKGGSFLMGKLGQKIASTIVTIIDDGLMPKGLSSEPFDGEGVPTNRKEVVSKGILQSYLYDAYTARKVKARSTGNARREHSSLPSIGPLNFFMQPGQASFADLIGSVKSGLYLTGLMGFGANVVTGDFSLGGAGLWIENGKLAYPVEGITVAANMMDLLQSIDMIGNDLIFLGSVATPTYRVPSMTVSGS
jgi:PmbA protein